MFHFLFQQLKRNSFFAVTLLFNFITMQEQDKLFLTVEECAVRYNISLRHFRRLVDDGVMPKPVKLGRCARWAVKALDEYDSRKIKKLMKPSPGKITSRSYIK
jgi:excisionase family DNA binding protein